GGGAMGGRSWQTTVDWSQVASGGHRSGRSEGRGHDMRRLGSMEDSEERSLDGPGNGAGGASDPDQGSGSGAAVLASQVGPSGMQVSMQSASQPAAIDPSQALLSASELQDEPV
ncbi:MAG TPA: hypothetical protein V6C72_18895, partial [Chroococcales cyanobacterium]